VKNSAGKDEEFAGRCYIKKRKPKMVDGKPVETKERDPLTGRNKLEYITPDEMDDSKKDKKIV